MTILIVDDHPLFRKGLIFLFTTSKYKNAKFVEANDGKEAVEIVRDTEVDVIFLDVSLPQMNGYETAFSILRIRPSSKIIMLSMIEELSAVSHFIKIGVRGYLTKDSEIDEIINSVDQVLEGNYYYSSKIDHCLFEKLCSETMAKTQFSKREMEVIKHLSKGFTNEDIGDKLKLSARSVESYRANLLNKAKVKNTAELIQFVYKNGIL
jgi:DNA-binding NarL/FixJ family response regulator